MDIDMYDYLMTIQMPPLPDLPKEEAKSEPQPEPKPEPKPLSAREQREKKKKELEDIRAWWKALPESERVKIRREPFDKAPKRQKKPKKPPEEKPPVKKPDPEPAP
jgi:hypothetical protein